MRIKIEDTKKESEQFIVYDKFSIDDDDDTTIFLK